MVRIEGSLDQLKRLELRGSIFTDLTAFMPATSVTTLVLHDISSGVLFSMLSKDSSSTIIFPSLQTLCLRGAATTFASVFGPDFTTALAGRAFHQTPVHRLIIEEPMDAGVGFHMLLHLQHIQELVLNGILYLVDEGKAETEAEFTDSGSDSDEDNNEWEDFWEYEGEEPLWQKVCDHISEDEDM
ncbi:hypothetical protein DL96DRAFT_1638331 [Flagelloscypha sp. PMI_526]|nr:hypothetical protein DL96DRAFT_1638331 [Flagelloscypha sp. PMI_526]